MSHNQVTLNRIVGVLYDLKGCGHIYDYYHTIRRGGYLQISLEIDREILEIDREMLEIDREILEISCERPSDC